MSFILEALRRAERERSNSNQAPELRIVSGGSGPQIAARKTPWPWIIGGIGLALGVAALVIVLLQPRNESAPAAPLVAAAPAPQPPAAAPVEESTEAMPESEMEYSDPADPQRLDDLVDPDSGLSEAPPPPQYVPREELQAQAELVTPPSPSRAPAAEPKVRETEVEQIELDPSPLPPVKTLQQMPPEYRADFPRLNFDVHFYDDNPARRFVMLNGKRYREGEKLVEGPSVVEITEDGVILSHRGQDVLLPSM